MEKLKMRSKDITRQNIETIGKLFPNVITETEDDEGNIIRAIDFEQLRQELSHEILEGDKESYQITWPGKKEAIVAANTPVDKTLRPIKEESLDWEGTENLYIEGDNLETLKLIQESYLGKIKCIYIDPPYNTGNDLIYRDNFAQDMDQYAEESGQIDDDGNRLFQNTEYNGRYHSDWLTMMYPRLKLARNLLSEDGVIFISIDDNEVHNLRRICDEIFGERNFIANLTIETGEVFGTKAAHIDRTFVKVKDYVLVYIKNCFYQRKRIPLFDSMREPFDTHYSTYISDDLEQCSLVDCLKEQDWVIDLFNSYNIELSLPNINKMMQLNHSFREYINEDLSKNLYTSQPYTGRIPADILKLLETREIVEYSGNLLYKTTTGSIRYYQPFSNGLYMTDDYKSTYTRASARGDLWKGFHYDMRNISDEGGVEFKNGKKPVRLIKQLIKWTNLSSGDIVLDFFSGSATTAHAVMELNAEDGGSRRYIMVQLPEAIDEKSEAYRAGYRTIADIGKERIRRAGKKIKEETGADIDYGFRVFKVDSSNMKDVYYCPHELNQDMIEQLESNIKEDRSGLDLLIQVMLETGLQLSLQIESKKLHGKEVHFVAGNSLVACFDEGIGEALIREIAVIEPLKAVFRDNSFDSCPDRINLGEIFKSISPSTEIRVL